MAEWFKALVLKTNVLSKIPGVRIPPYPNFDWLNSIIGNVLDCKSYDIGSSPVLAFIK